MSELEVRIVRLEAMRVASVYAYSATPEHDAWGKLEAWAGPKGLLDDPEGHPTFGFDNPDPSPDSPRYGYEFWIKVGPEIEPQGDVRIQGFYGGLYAVTRCKLANIGETWGQLHKWVEDRVYKSAYHRALEKAQNPGASDDELILDLYYPIAE